MPPTDQEQNQQKQDMRRRVIGSALGAAALVVVATTWAALPAPLPAVPASLTDEAARPAAAKRALTAAAWTVSLWQPLTDAPPAVVRSAAVTIKLFSILTQDGAFTAAIDPDDGGPLVYAHVGDTVKGVTIAAIDAVGISIQAAGATHRLELAP
jgi:hypothetical protein